MPWKNDTTPNWRREFRKDRERNYAQTRYNDLGEVLKKYREEGEIDEREEVSVKDLLLWLRGKME